MLVQTTSSARWENLLTMERCTAMHSDGEGGEEQRWRERGVSILHSHKQRGWAGGTQKQRIVFLSFLVHSHLFLHLFCASYLSSLLSFVLLSTFLCFWSSVSTLSALSFQLFASFLSSSSVFHTIFVHKGQRVWQDDVLWRHRDLKMGTQIYGQTEFKETRSVPEGQRQQQQKKTPENAILAVSLLTAETLAWQNDKLQVSKSGGSGLALC